MDAKLLAWARAVKTRRRHGPPLPPLWIFSDPVRLPDPVPILRGLPRGLCGLVCRPAPGTTPDAIRRVARVCRERGIALMIAGPYGAPGGGEHRGSHWRRRRPGAGVFSASAHGLAELVQARKGRAAMVFLSPVFPTASHPGAPALGIVRWAGLAHQAGLPVLALGGVSGVSVGRLPRICAGIGMIGAAV